MATTLLCSDSVLEPLVPKGNKIEDFVDIKAGNILKNSDNFRWCDSDVLVLLFHQSYWNYLELGTTLSRNSIGEFNSWDWRSFLSLLSTAR